jgi:Thiol:disulfide interchange protein
VLGMSVTYSALGVAAALTGQLFGAALQNPVVIGVIVAVLVALALSMFGLWELKVPNWAVKASGGRTGYLGAGLMGLLVGFVAAPCIGPFVLGLLTYVGRTGNPLLGFVLFFALAMGLGLPYLLLGTFTGAINKMPASGAWMVGVRKVFGVILLALAVYFLKPLLPAAAAAWLMGLTLILGGLYMLVIERTAHEQPTIDRVMRLLAAILLVVGVLQLPRGGENAARELTWQPYDRAAVERAVSDGRPVIVDFFADWCAPCKELDEKTFADPRVRSALAGYARFKVDLTRSTEANQRLIARYGVQGVPTVILFRNGREVDRLTGFEPPERFLTRVE